MIGRRMSTAAVAVAAAALIAAPAVPASASAGEAPCVIQDITSVYECATTIIHNLLRADR